MGIEVWWHTGFGRSNYPVYLASKWRDARSAFEIAHVQTETLAPVFAAARDEERVAFQLGTGRMGQRDRCRGRAEVDDELGCARLAQQFEGTLFRRARQHLALHAG